MSSSMRKLARTVARLVRVADGQTRAQQLSRSVIVSGENASTVSDLLTGAAETAAITVEQAGDIARLDESDILAVELLADASDYTDLIRLEEAVSDQAQEASDQFDQSTELDEAIHAAHMTAIGANLAVTEAIQGAADAVEAAANAQTTADGKNSRRRGSTEPVAPDGGWVQGDQWVRDNENGIPVELLVWNGESFVPETTLTGELLVIGEDGTVRLSDGTVTADSIATGALDFVVARGAQFYGGYIEAPVIVSSDRLGSGANLLNDPTFQSAVNTAWVASGHLGDAAVNVTDTFTWDQTVQREAWMANPAATLRYRGSAITSLALTPATRKTGSLLFANYSWKPANRTYNNPFTYPNPRPYFWYGNTGGQSAEEFKKATVPTTVTPTSRTTYLTNTAVVTVAAGERWNVRTGFTKVNASDTDLVTIRVELINSITNAVVWFYDTSAAERTAGAINTWFEPTAAASLKLRIRAVYTAGGGAVVRRMNPGGRVWATVNGSITTDWTATTTNAFHDYASVPGDQTPTGTRGQPPAKIKRRAEMNVVMTSAVFAKVEPQQGWRLTEQKGLELFNSLGAQTGRVDGENNFLAGRFATKDAGSRWEIQGDRVVYFNDAEIEVGGLRRSGTQVELFGAIKLEGDTVWANAALLSGVTGSATWRRRLGSIEIFFDCTTASIAPNGSVNLFTLPAAALEGLPVGGLASLAVVTGGTGSGTGQISQTSGQCAVRNLHTSALDRFRGNASWPAS